MSDSDETIDVGDQVVVTHRAKLPSEPGPDYFYAKGKMAMAVHALAVGRGPIKERLIKAYSEFSPLQENELPEQLRDDYRWVRQTLTKNPPKQRAAIRDGRVIQESTGRLGATVPYMRIATAVSVAEKICSIEARLATWVDTEDKA